LPKAQSGCNGGFHLLNDRSKSSLVEHSHVGQHLAAYPRESLAKRFTLLKGYASITEQDVPDMAAVFQNAGFASVASHITRHFYRHPALPAEW